MKNCTAASRILVCAAFLFVFGVSAWAQVSDAQSAPPAYGVAQRLITQAQAARTAGQFAAHSRAYQAVKELQQVVASKTYGHTTYAREALRQQAKISEDFLQDKNAAIQSLQTLHNTFPDDKAVLPEIQRVGDALDKWNQTFQPPPAPAFHNVGAVLYKVMDFLVSLTGRQSYSYWIAILLISILVKLALTPLSNKQYGSMKEMQKLQPLIQELQAKHKNDKELLGKKMMELYKEHGVNPAAGCAPLIVQLPILYLLYYMIRLYQFQFSHGTFLWIGHNFLTQQYPQYFGLNLGQPDIPILLLYAASMYVTQRMTVTPTMDPQQAETQRMMAIMTPFMTTYFFLQYHLPSAFVLYYLTFNILSTAQQKYYMRRRQGDPAPMLVKRDSGDDDSGGNSSRNGRIVPIARSSNGTAPTAKGVIAPKKTHPKKKRR